MLKVPATEQTIEGLLAIAHYQDVVCEFFPSQRMQGEIYIILVVFYQQYVEFLQVHDWPPALAPLLFDPFFFSASRMKRKGCALIRFALRPHRASVFLNNALYRRQTYTGAFKILFPVQSLENAE